MHLFQPSKQQLLPPVLSGYSLKLLAILTMLIDHIGAVLLENGYLYAYVHHLPGAPSYEVAQQILALDRSFRLIGRMAFPIFCFLLVEGFLHTSNRKKYMERLFLFAFLSEIPFDLCFRQKFLEISYQNVMFTLLIGFLVLYCAEKYEERFPSLVLLWPAAGLLLAYAMKTDYSWKGVFLIVILYHLRNFPLERTVGGCLALVWEPPAWLAFVPINMYNHTRGRSMKYFFYFFYPVHLLLLFSLRYILLGI